MQKNVLLISLVFLYFLKCFGFNSLRPLCNDYFGVVILLMIYSQTCKSFCQYRYKKELMVFFVFIAANILSCHYFRGQSIYESVRYAYFPFYVFFSYFVFRRLELSVDVIEKVIFILTIVFICCYLVQFLNPTLSLFVSKNQTEVFMSSFHQQRFRLAGQGICSLGLFMSLNKYLLLKEMKYLWVAFASFSCIMLMGFRTLTVALVFAACVLIIKLFGLKMKTIAIFISFLVVFIVFFNTSWGERVIDAFVDRQDAMFNNSEYIRMISLDYHLHRYFKSPIEYFFGSGVPYLTDVENVCSNYGKEIRTLQSSGLIYQDWGVLGYSWIWGVIPVLCMIVYSIKSIFIRVPREYYYLSIWLLFLVVGSITTAEMFRPGAFFLQMVVLVLIEKNEIAYDEKKYIVAV